jgi:glyoxylase-like metal-dependent hydrolase (beta-lactamase superfamily II)
MSEPREVASRVEEVAPGVYHWRIVNSAIGGVVCSSHAVVVDGRSVLIDPLRLTDDALEQLPPPVAVVLSATCHQRSAWHYRSALGIEVWAPEDAHPPDGLPDRTFGAWDVVPGRMLAIPTPGPQASHYAFLLERDPGVLFCGDLVANGEDGTLAFIPPDYQDDPAEAHRSVERLLNLPFTVLCMAHGTPVADQPKRRLRRLVETAPAPSTFA